MTTAITLSADPAQYAGLAKESEEGLALVREILTHPIDDQSDLDWLNEVGHQVKARSKEIESIKKQATDPINSALKAIRGWFKPIETSLAALETATKTRIGEYYRAREAERLSATRSAQALLTAGADSAETRTAILAIPEAPKTAGTTVRRVWKFEIVCPDDVPRNLCLPDSRLIGNAVAGGAREIPGVRIYEDTQVIMRSI